LGHCAKSRKVASSCPDGVTGIFHLRNPCGRPVALGSTQPRTEMSTRNISCRVKAVGAYSRQPYHLHVPIFLKSGSLNLLELARPLQACTRIAVSLPLSVEIYSSSSIDIFLTSRLILNILLPQDPV
jgi:hypothetical protein